MIIGIVCGGIILLIMIITIIIKSCNSKIKFLIIKLEEAEKNIESFLKEKYEKLIKIKPMIENEINEKNFLNKLEDLNIKNESYLESNKKLADYYIELIKTIDENDKLLNNEDIEKLIEEIEDNELNLFASIKYYNDTADKFNKQLSSFPSNIIKLFFGYRKKEFYKNEKREMYEILNEK